MNAQRSQIPWPGLAMAALVWGVILFRSQWMETPTAAGPAAEASTGLAPATAAAIPTRIPRGIIVGWDCPPPRTASPSPNAGEGVPGSGNGEAREEGGEGSGEGRNTDRNEETGTANPSETTGGQGAANRTTQDVCPPPTGWKRAVEPRFFWKLITEQDSMIRNVVVATTRPEAPEIENGTFEQVRVRRIGAGWQPVDPQLKLIWTRWRLAANDNSKLHPGMILGWLIQAECLEALPGQLEPMVPRHWLEKL